jgi:hypothetical protein
MSRLGARVWIDHSLAPLAAGLVKGELERTAASITNADRDAPPDTTSPETLHLLVHVRLLARLLGQLADAPEGEDEAATATRPTSRPFSRRRTARAGTVADLTIEEVLR